MRLPVKAYSTLPMLSLLVLVDDMVLGRRFRTVSDRSSLRRSHEATCLAHCSPCQNKSAVEMEDKGDESSLIRPVMQPGCAFWP